MRRFILSGTFLILLGALYFLWQFRFERSPGIPSLSLEDLRLSAIPASGVEWLGAPGKSSIRLRVVPGQAPPVTRFDLPGVGETGLLHLKFVLSANELRPGIEDWEDGRGIIEWHPPGGGPEWENDPFGAARHDQAGDITELIARPESPPAIPALRLENLGSSGDLVLSRFEASVVRERMIWKIGRWLLLAGWLGWAFSWIGYRGQGRRVRPLLAGCVWILMGIYFVVPGPWKSIRSFGEPFRIGDEILESPKSVQVATALEPSISAATPRQPVIVKSVGKIPEKGDITLRIKHYVQKARPFLHVALLFGPAFLIACLVGWRPSLSLSIILAISIEAAQVAFGFGFDRWDIVDLACDAAGIALALLVHRHMQRRWPRLIAR